MGVRVGFMAKAAAGGGRKWWGVLDLSLACVRLGEAVVHEHRDDAA